MHSAASQNSHSGRRFGVCAGAIVACLQDQNTSVTYEAAHHWSCADNNSLLSLIVAQLELERRARLEMTEMASIVARYR